MAYWIECAERLPGRGERVLTIPLLAFAAIVLAAILSYWFLAPSPEEQRQAKCNALEQNEVQYALYVANGIPGVQNTRVSNLHKAINAKCSFVKQVKL